MRSFDPGGRPWALVPVKGFAAAKSRLAPALSLADRQRLARHWADRVLDVLVPHGGLSGVSVVTDSDEVASWAADRAVRVLRDQAVGLGRVVDAALETLSRQQGVQRALVLMTDLPRFDSPALDRLLEASRGMDWLVAPDRHGMGTNALICRLPVPGGTCFGRPDSALQHRKVAADRGLRYADLVDETLGWDVDEPEDLGGV